METIYDLNLYTDEYGITHVVFYGTFLNDHGERVTSTDHYLRSYQLLNTVSPVPEDEWYEASVSEDRTVRFTDWEYTLSDMDARNILAIVRSFN